MKKRTKAEQRRFDDRTILIKGTGWTVGDQIRFWKKELAKNHKPRFV